MVLGDKVKVSKKFNSSYWGFSRFVSFKLMNDAVVHALTPSHSHHVSFYPKVVLKPRSVSFNTGITRLLSQVFSQATLTFETSSFFLANCERGVPWFCSHRRRKGEARAHLKQRPAPASPPVEAPPPPRS